MRPLVRAMALIATACVPPDEAAFTEWQPGTPLTGAFDDLDPTAPPPTQSLLLEVSTAVPGQQVTWTVTGLRNGELATFLSSSAGFGAGRCILPPGGPCVDLLPVVKLLGQAHADATGTARYARAVPANVTAGSRVGVQVVVMRGAGGVHSLKSNPVLTIVESGVPGIAVRPANPTCVAPARPATTASLDLTARYTYLSLSLPTTMVEAPDDPTWWYVGEQGGQIKRFPTDESVHTEQSILDLTGSTVSGGELGLLSIAMHPDFAHNGYMFVYRTRGTAVHPVSRIARFTSIDGGETFDPSSELVILEVNQPYANHNGGNLLFGPDGNLYFGFGDGGSGNDPGGRAQDTSVLLGKFLRLDVDHGTPYAIPADNPFASGVGGRPEIYAVGVRNPYRWSFDRLTGAAWVGDVGQDNREEIDVLTLGGNYGWKVMEGTRCSNPPATGPGCNDPIFVPPVWEYSHGTGSRSVIGGYVYRGQDLPQIQGTYLFADFYLGQIFGLYKNPITGVSTAPVVASLPGIQISTFAEDHDGEIFLADYTGRVFELTDATPPTTVFPIHLSDTGCFRATKPSVPLSGLIPYHPRSPLWSDGLDKRRWMAVPDGKTIHVEADGDFTFPIGTVLAKEFSYGGRRVETRLFMRHSDGDWGAYTYLWNAAQTDAELLTRGADVALGGGLTWHVPSQSECFACHTVAAGRSLGAEVGQLNGPASYGRLWSNQLATLDHIGMFDTALGDPQLLASLSTLDGPDSAEARSRAYLHANCAMCHRPGGGSPVDIDLRASTSLHDTRLCGVAPTSGTLGVANARRISPGDPTHSILALRMASLDPAVRMPRLGTTVPHDDAITAVEDWILDTSTCP